MEEESASQRKPKHSISVFASVSSGILPAVGSSPDIHSTHFRKWIIPPYHRHYGWWQNWLIVLVVYTAWVSPFEFAFRKVNKGPLFYVDNIVNAFFAIDIVVTFFVAYLDMTTYLLVEDFKKIALQYVCRGFILDLASTIPFQIIYLAFTENGNANNEIFIFLNMLRLWRLRRISELFTKLEKDIRFNYFWTRIVKLISVTLFVVHSAACFYYWLAAHYSNRGNTWLESTIPNFKEKSIWRGYVASIYWAITTVTTIGDTIDEASKYAAKPPLPEWIKLQMMAQLQLNFKTRELQQDTLAGLPKALRSNIYHHLFLPTVENTYIFKGVSRNMLLQFVAEMKGEYFPPNVDIILKNQIPGDFYIIVSGTVFLEKEGTPNLVGENALLLDIPQPFTVRTTKLNQLLRLGPPMIQIV
ncbi:hypothetical protein SUGI_1111110 [Cryptomeria japonica]|nr:hypothetical protein SUGI_1111110 [Cryptomeria japonica]